MEKVELAIGRLLLVGVLISFVTVFVGGTLYLLNHWNDIIHYEAFHSEPIMLKSITDILKSAFSSSLGLIQLGLLILVIVQVLRVTLTAFYFVKLRDKSFILISLFVLWVLIYSLIWRF